MKEEIAGTRSSRPHSPKGITLIALIITIIIMLILAGVVIAIVIEGGLFEQANEAATRTEIGRADDEAAVITGTAISAGYASNKGLLDRVRDAAIGTGFDWEGGVSGNDEEVTIKDEKTGKEYKITEEGLIAGNTRR